VSLPFYLLEPGPYWYDGRIPWHTLDLETTNLDKGDPRNPNNRIVLSCMDGRTHTDLSHSELDADRLVLVAHNAKFELGWLLRYGYDLSNILPWDTMLAEYVLAGNRQVDLSLDATARRYGMPGKEKVIDAMMKAGICPSEMPDGWLRQRVEYDVGTTLAVAQLQYALLKHRGLLPVFFTRCIVTPVLAAIETVGMRLDPERVIPEYASQYRARADADTQLTLMSGGINLRSRPQLGKFLYDDMGFEELTDRDGNPKRTASGLRATDGDSLAALIPVAAAPHLRRA
jgi:DNA polymerase I-like protein with 3'-5' exonuclease and polymerase domains